MHRVILTRCDQCTRGVVPNGAWGDPCAHCKGQGVITLSHLAETLDEWPETLRVLFAPKPRDPRMRARTCARVLGKIVTRFPDLFSKQPRLFP